MKNLGLFEAFSEAIMMDFAPRRCKRCGDEYFDGFNCAGLCPCCWNQALETGCEETVRQDRQDQRDRDREARALMRTK